MKLVFSGGLNENDGTLPTECQEGANFDLVQGSSNFRPRRPLDLKDTTTQASPVNGIMQLIKKDDTETTLVFEADATTPTIYSWNGSAFTSQRTATLATTSKLRDTYWPLDEYIVITDLMKTTPLLKWDATDCTRLKTGLSSGSASSISSITRSGTTATMTYGAAHGRSTGDLVVVAGADQTDYNIEAEITRVSATVVTYTVSGAPTTPATGTITADTGVEVYAKYSVIHQGRLWLFNITTDSNENAHMMVASVFENPESLDTTTRAQDGGFSTGNEAFYMLSPDLKSINGAVVFMNQLIITTDKGQLFKLTGADSTDYAWKEFYQGSAAIGTESIQNIGNDVIFMREGGNIELLSSTQQFGDVRGDDVSRWIPDTVQDISDSQIIYDKTLQKVLFFVSGKVLVLFKDKLGAGQESPWSIYKTALTFNMNVNAARYMRRPGEDTWTVYCGDATGNIFDINGAGSGDSGNTDIASNRKTQLIQAGEGLNIVRNILQGRVQYRRVGNCDITFEFDWTDTFATSSAIFTLNGATSGDTATYFGGDGYFGGEFYYNEGFSFSDKVANLNFSPSGKGQSFFMNISLGTSVRYKVDHILLGA